MAGIYIHIPFCKRKCLYCDFFSTMQHERIEEYINALIREIHIRKNETDEPIRTIYLGGGTPSLLCCKDIERIIKTIDTSQTKEITIEINPGDATPEYIRQLRQMGINRLSIGIQSFQNQLLKKIGRRHNAQQAIQTIQIAQECGFENISIDLMYALPEQTMELWQKDINIALQLNVQHISSYGLIYEENTPLTRLAKERLIVPIDEDTENHMYDYLCQRLTQNGFIHYEISNFALPGCQAVHNSNYWNFTPYIGIGAGAHSYIHTNKETSNIYTRIANIENIDRYIYDVMAYNLHNNIKTWQKNEILTLKDMYNEYVMLSLRTNIGISISELTKKYHLIVPSKKEIQYKKDIIQHFVDKKLLSRTSDNYIVATQKGKHILNQIIQALMIDE